MIIGLRTILQSLRILIGISKSKTIMLDMENGAMNVLKA